MGTGGKRFLAVWIALLLAAVPFISLPAGASSPGTGSAQSRLPAAAEWDPLNPPEGFQLISWGTWLRPTSIPFIAVEPCRPFSPETSGYFSCYIVQKGDWLWKIARAAIPQVPFHCALTDPHEVALRANWLYHVNSHEIGPDPNVLRPGMQLKVGASGFLLSEVVPCVE